MINTLATASYSALINLWNGFILFLPTLLGGIILFLLGLIIGNGLGQLVEKIIELIKLDTALEKTGFKKITDRAGIQLNTGFFFGQIVKWLILLSFLVAACNVWGLTAVGDFIKSIVDYIPNLIVAILILLVSIILGEYFAKFTRASVASAGLKYKNFLSSLTRWVFYIFGLLAALSQLKIATYIFNTLFTGIVALLALAGGLAFGLGGKELAQDLMKKLKEEVEEK
jgi:small-conductance mechanosensitive channel